MTKRFGQFKGAIQEYINNQDEKGDLQNSVASLLPSATDQIKIIALEKALEEFHLVSLYLQKDDGKVSLLDVRVLFDSLIATYGADFEYYLAPDANIVNNQDFENAIVNFLRDDTSMCPKDIAILQPFEISVNNDADNNSSNNNNTTNIVAGALAVLHQHRKRQRTSQKYVNIAAFPVTSNIVERFFSQVKLNMTTQQNSLLPKTLETLMFLKMNSNLMSTMTVQTAMNMLRVPAAASNN
jgi:hypothetical protein